ncbi:cbb3-type cytochrome c oxidase subunit 3 [Aestuariivirga litoralis]|uniref:cbb3-type cytochrome c oxidase subunit 3 n=1 Tax=Aestuariivirga litoralis TaxID=2650924 RepID=UPI0018C4682D|nr:cbb3-type cytochrome c oxidase subunit 3 [Aestuariivirga litoralis]MBG1230734.1 cbb3-type cytochrome c oxidase subunit 3 [Aestuariivirga litoralis]
MTFEYQALRTLVDSWGLLVMVLFFIGAAGMALLPGSRQQQADAAQIPFKED